MTTQISNESPKVFFSNGRLVTNSQAVADYFDKQHKHVLAKIDALDCSPEFTSANFSADAQTVEIGNGAERESRCFLITKDGFMFLVMGFTGKKAARLKEAYIAKFNLMETELQQRSNQAAPAIYPVSGRVLFEYDNGVVVRAHAPHPDEFLMTREGHTEMLRLCGYVVIHNSTIKSLTVEEILRLGEVSRQENLRWEKDCQHAPLTRRSDRIL